MRAVLLVLLAAAAWAAWHWSRYPGNWVFAFSPKYENERAKPAERRRDLRGLDKEADRVEKSARERVDAEEVKYREDIKALEREVQNLLSPGLGRQLRGPVGELTLYEHGVMAAGRTKPIPLAGLEVEFRSDPVFSIDLVEPGLRTYRAKYPRRPAPEDEETPFLSEEQLSDFALEIQNAAADENDFQTHREVRLPRARQELDSAQKNTAYRDAARRNLAQVCAQQKRDPSRKNALAELDAQRDRWEELTGKRPPR